MFDWNTEQAKLFAQLLRKYGTDYKAMLTNWTLDPKPTIKQLADRRSNVAKSLRHNGAQLHYPSSPTAAAQIQGEVHVQVMGTLSRSLCETHNTYLSPSRGNARPSEQIADITNGVWSSSNPQVLISGNRVELIKGLSELDAGSATYSIPFGRNFYQAEFRIDRIPAEGSVSLGVHSDDGSVAYLNDRGEVFVNDQETITMSSELHIGETVGVLCPPKSHAILFGRNHQNYEVVVPRSGGPRSIVIDLNGVGCCVTATVKAPFVIDFSADLARLRLSPSKFHSPNVGYPRPPKLVCSPSSVAVPANEELSIQKTRPSLAPKALWLNNNVRDVPIKLEKQSNDQRPLNGDRHDHAESNQLQNKLEREAVSICLSASSTLSQHVSEYGAAGNLVKKVEQSKVIHDTPHASLVSPVFINDTKVSQVEVNTTLKENKSGSEEQHSNENEANHEASIPLTVANDTANKSTEKEYEDNGRKSTASEIEEPKAKRHKKALPLNPEDWITNIGMAQYWPKLRDSGFDMYQTLTVLNEHALDQMGVVLLGHRLFLLAKCAELRSLFD